MYLVHLYTLYNKLFTMLATPPDRQSRKRLATRQKISDAASRLFVERGFDKVTVDEIATAADVARMTVFNHFARKEDMFFDLDEQGRKDLRAALEQRDAGTSPIEALRLFAHRAIAEQLPYVRFFEEGSELFMRTIMGSEALKARARAIRDELTEMLAVALAKTGVRQQPNPAATLAATLLVATWEVAFLEAHRIFRRGQDVKKANKAFLAIVDQGTRGVKAAVEGSSYT
jgi:AcrR family transcriptional regulator